MEHNAIRTAVDILNREKAELHIEVERLAKERDEAWEARDEYIRTNVTLRAEVERLRADNEHLRTQIRLLTKILQLEFLRRSPNRSEKMRKVHEIINSVQFGFHRRP
jgi:Centrosome localisation domain of PPC89